MPLSDLPTPETIHPSYTAQPPILASVLVTVLSLIQLLVISVILLEALITKPTHNLNDLLLGREPLQPMSSNI